MKYCKNCGTMLTDEAKFCTNCGTRAEEIPSQSTNTAGSTGSQDADFFNTSARQEQRRQEARQKAAGFAQEARQKAEEFIDQMDQVSDETGSFAQEDIAGHKGMAALSYFGILVLIPLFACRDSKYVQFHVNQGLLLMISSVVLNVLSRLLGFLHLGLIGGLLSVLHLPLFVFCIMGIINAAKGRAKELPVIGHYRLL